MAYIQAIDLVKVYRIKNIEIQALRGLSLEVNEGELVAVIGPSGSGKTTLLNILGGLTTATAGYVSIANRDLTSMSRAELVNLRQFTVGHIFQTFNLIPNLTASENVELPMIAAGVPAEKRKTRVRELLEIVGLSERANHKPDEISGGEKQRVAIAAALANDPPIILADEPTGELDTKTSQQVVEYIKHIREEFGKTIIMVTHDTNVARQTDRIFRIEDGRIKAVTTPSKIEEHVGGAGTQIAYIRSRLEETARELLLIEKQFRQNKISGNEFAQSHHHLTQTQTFLELELQRLGA
ncbi:MAG: ABC transporter ATP-binding protein [Candidatus Ranarchaeia archaeon]